MNTAGEGVFILLRRENNQHIIANIDGKSGQRIAQIDDFKTYGVAAQILQQLGVTKMRVLGSRRKLFAIKGFNLEVVEYLERIPE